MSTPPRLRQSCLLQQEPQPAAGRALAFYLQGWLTLRTVADGQSREVGGGRARSVSVAPDQARAASSCSVVVLALVLGRRVRDGMGWEASGRNTAGGAGGQGGANLQGMHAGVNHLQRLHDSAQLLRNLPKNK